MVAGAVVSALGTYLFTLVGTRSLGDVAFEPIAVLWTLQFLTVTIVYVPVEQLIIRRLTLSGSRASVLTATVPAIGAFLVAGVALPVAFIAVTLDHYFAGDPVYLASGAVLFAAFGAYAVGRGFLAGRFRFRAYGAVVGAESSFRLLLGIAVVLTIDTAVGLSWAMAVAPLVFFAARPFGRDPGHDLPEVADDRSVTGFLGGLLATTAASQTILAAGPLAVGALGADPGEVSVFFVTFTLFRGPLTASYNLLAKVLHWFTSRDLAGAGPALRRRAIQVGLTGTVVSVAGGVAGAVLGPDVVALLYGSEFRPDAGVAALAAAGVVLAATALFIGQLLVARGTTGLLGASWVVALAFGLAVMAAVSGTASLRVAWGFLAADVMALAATMALIARRDGRDG
jgi:hypothetical protein